MEEEKYVTPTTVFVLVYVEIVLIQHRGRGGVHAMSVRSSRHTRLKESAVTLHE